MPRPGSNIRLDLLKTVAQDLRYLLRRGYHKAPALNFLANRWQLNALEREVLTRAVFHHEEAPRRRRKRVRIKDLREQTLAVDGHNVLITVESGLRGLPVFVCDDGFVRDASRLSRKFRRSPLTIKALHALGEALLRLPLKRVVIYFDAPLSKSGELAAETRSLLREMDLSGESRVVPSADLSLSGKALLASSDAALIETAGAAFDLGAYVLKRLGLKPFRL